MRRPMTSAAAGRVASERSGPYVPVSERRRPCPTRSPTTRRHPRRARSPGSLRPRRSNGVRSQPIPVHDGRRRPPALGSQRDRVRGDAGRRGRAAVPDGRSGAPAARGAAAARRSCEHRPMSSTCSTTARAARSSGRCYMGSCARRCRHSSGPRPPPRGLPCDNQGGGA
jgi:hypothetical protein